MNWYRVSVAYMGPQIEENPQPTGRSYMIQQSGLIEAISQGLKAYLAEMKVEGNSVSALIAEEKVIVNLSLQEKKPAGPSPQVVQMLNKSRKPSE